MTRHVLVSAAMLLAFPAAAQVSPDAVSDPPPAAEATEGTDPAQPTDYDLAKEKVANCEGEKFVFAWGAGARPTKVTLCSDKGATAEEIAAMLEDAANKIQKTASIEEDRRVALVQQIRAKIEEVKMRAQETKSASVAQGAPPEPDRVVSAAPEFSALPPLPAPTGSAPAPAGSATAPLANRPVVAPPRLGFECITPGEFAAGGPCVTLTRDTVVIVESRDPMPDPVELRFFRDGSTRGEVTLGAMRKGQSRRVRLPRQVCSGVSTGEVAIRVVRAGQVVDTEGPYLLRC